MRKQRMIKKVYKILLAAGLAVLAFSSGSTAAPLQQPGAIIALPENENAIIVEKKTQTLFLYSADSSQITLAYQTPCSTGEVSGVKKQAGDKKTPEGVYFLVDEYEDRYLSPIYGKKAFPTDYPNLVDKRSGKNGSAIWIHGTNKTLKPMDSNGCVALENSSILTLSEYITLNATPVIMVETAANEARELLAEKADTINRLIQQWMDALIKGSYHDYLFFYSDQYMPDMSWWEEWVDVRKEADKHDPKYQLSVDRTGIYQYDDTVVALFDLFLHLQQEKLYLGKRKLFFEHAGGGYKIVGDIYQHKPKELENQNHPLLAVAKKKGVPGVENQAVLKTVNQWLAAWRAKDMDQYAGFYAKQFYSDGLNKKQWVRRKRNLARKYNYINVSGTDFKVSTDGRTSMVVFFQEYASSGFTTEGTKTLKLVDEGGLWKIYQESWKEK